MFDLQKWIKSTTGIITSITVLLTLLISLLNTGRDLYIKILDLPITPEQKINRVMFEKHFNDKPAVSQPIKIGTASGKFKEVCVDIYKNGDIYFKFGKNSRWFPFNDNVVNAKYEFISSAFAESNSTEGPYMIKQKYQGNNIVREKIYEDTSREKIIINKNTGTVIEKSSMKRKLSPQELSEIQKGTKTIKNKSITIDLKNY